MTDTLTPGYADTDLRLGLRGVAVAYREEYESDDSDVDIIADVLASTLETILAHYLPDDVSALDVAAAMHAHTYCGEDVVPAHLISALLRGIKGRKEELGEHVAERIAEYRANNDG